MEVLNAKEYGINGQEKQNILKLYKLLNHAKNLEKACIYFEEGTYEFYPDYAIEELLYISNHDEDALKRIAFPLKGFKDLTLKGNNTSFKFHTDMIPFYIYNSENISIEGISIDYERTIYSEGEIVDVSNKSMKIRIDREKYPYEIRHKRLYFVGENFKNELTHFLEMDRDTYSPAYNTKDVHFNNPNYGLSASFIEERDLVKIELNEGENNSFKLSHKIGNKLILRHHPRSHPGFYVRDSKNVKFKDVNLYHCSAMGLIAQHTENITLDNFNIKINPNNRRVFTATADATHFVYCYGKISIENCLFENQLDDPVNIHGIYAQITDILNCKEIIVKLIHSQQKGVRIGKVNERLGIVDNDTMITYGEGIIKNIEIINKDYIHIEFVDQISNKIKIGHVVENLEYVPDVIIRNCILRNNRARGFLLTSAGNVIVENNYFSVPGAGILIEGDANYWFESGSTKNIVIRNNIFDNCAYVKDWAEAPIQISPMVNKISGNERYHKKISIIGNTFKCFDERLVYARSVENLEFIDNNVIKTDKYKPLGNEKFVLKDVENFKEKY